MLIKNKLITVLILLISLHCLRIGQFSKLYKIRQLRSVLTVDRQHRSILLLSHQQCLCKISNSQDHRSRLLSSTLWNIWSNLPTLEQCLVETIMDLRVAHAAISVTLSMLKDMRGAIYQETCSKTTETRIWRTIWLMRSEKLCLRRHKSWNNLAWVSSKTL